jgi:quinol monooxygenase YgiN
MGYLVSVDFHCKDGAAEAVGDMLRAALPETRQFDGCQSVDVYFDASANTYTALEQWDTADHYRRYLQFRTDQGIADAVAPVLEGGWDAVVSGVKWLGEKTGI